jgi:hypothetical protein
MFRGFAVAALSAVFGCATLLAETEPAADSQQAKPAAAAAEKPKTPAPPAPKVYKWGKVIVSGTFRTRLETWDWFQGDTGDSAYPYLGNIGRLSFSQNLEKTDWQLEFGVPFQLGLPSTAVASAAPQGALGLGANYFTNNLRRQNAIGFFPKQAFVRFKGLGSPANSLRIGRFEFNDGTEMAPKNGTLAALKMTRINQRVIGAFGWTHVGRSFDGIHFQNNKPTGNFTFVGALPTRGVFQNDGWGWNNTAFGYGSYTKPYGSGNVASESRLFGIYYHDWRRVLKTDSRPVAIRRADMGNIRMFTGGGHSVHAFNTGAGTFDLLFWGAVQGGSWGVLDHRAAAGTVEAGWQPKVAKKLKPWVRGGYYYGSGDGDPNDNKHGNFFQILPTPRPFARFPFFNMMNNKDAFGALILRPSPKWTFTSEAHDLRLASSRDLWYQGGGVFQPWSFGYVGRPSNGRSSLARLYDISADYKYSASVGINAYFGWAQGGDVVRTIYPRGKNGAFAYLELNYKF